MTLNPDFALNCVLRQHVWSSEAWLSQHMASLILVRNVVGELQPKRTLAALRGFLAAARLSCFGKTLFSHNAYVTGRQTDATLQPKRDQYLENICRCYLTTIANY